MLGGKLKVKAPGKVNLFLEVLDRRPDGYHGIRSLMAHVSLCDVLTLEKTRGGIHTTIRMGGVPVWKPRNGCSSSRDNLATRAAVALRKATGYKGGARITIEKHIPICGGLGGGSADAAATLRGLNELWQTGLSVGELSRIARDLGSDVPSMVFCGLVTLGGKGDRVKPLIVDRRRHSAKWYIVVANPGFGVATKDICGRYTSTLTSARGQFKGIVSAVSNWNIEEASSQLFNSLDKVVFAKYPLLAVIADELKKAGARGVLLSGSGASVFALASSWQQARAIAGKVGHAMGPWLWTRVAEVLPDGVTVAHGPLEARV